jgi:predicted lipid-binding transport protein (Tim44 family)
MIPVQTKFNEDDFETLTALFSADTTKAFSRKITNRDNTASRISYVLM